MSNKLTDTEVASLVIEDLMDSDFNPGEHDAYAYITDRYSQLSKGRVGSAMLQLLNGVNWGNVEAEIARLKGELVVSFADQELEASV